MSSSRARIDSRPFVRLPSECQQPKGKKMADIYDVLYCFACEEHAILVKRRASKTATARCDNCGAENEIGKILNAMKLKGIVMPPPRWTH